MSSSIDLRAVHRAMIGFNKRAERAADPTLVATFVDSEPLFDLLSTPNNQVVYGRRGTGKTHALKYLAEAVETKGERSIYLDLRSVGSNGSIYSDSSKSLHERASTLILDVISGLYDELYRLALEIIERHPSPEELTRRLDALQEALTSFRIEDPRVARTESDRSATTNERRAGIKVKPSDVDISAQGSRSQTNEIASQTTREGQEVVHLVFGDITGAIGNLLEMLGKERVWLLIDEWSEVPVELQPYLADLIRRTILPIPEITVKIAAIEHRSSFALLREKGAYIGLELGADLSADLNLDDFLVFDNSQDKSTDFVKRLIFKHYSSAEGEIPQFDNPDDLVGSIFTQYPVFEEFVRAVEGVPRDALNLAAKIATKAFGQQIAMEHVRSAARDWYNQDKSAAIRSSPELEAVLAFIVDQVIGERRARAFLFSTNRRNLLIDKLFDSRLLHILKKNVSSHDDPGRRFDVYKIDYGCYVDLINTTKAPQGLFELEDDGFVEVPKDDYRSIRRAILDPEDLEKFEAV